MADQTQLTIPQQAEQALIKLGEKAPGQAAVFVAQLTPAEQLAAAQCLRRGEKARLIDLLDHIATRQSLEADFAAHSSPATGPDDPTDVEAD